MHKAGIKHKKTTLQQKNDGKPALEDYSTSAAHSCQAADVE